MTGDLLQIRDLSVQIGDEESGVSALSAINLHVGSGEVVGLVGESGGGKSMIARSIIGMLPEGARATGSVLLSGADVLTMSDEALVAHRGSGAAMCFQNPRSALSPVRTVGRQLIDRLEVHQGLSGKAARAAAVHLLGEVGIRNPDKRLRSYPHEMSGGMCQRVMIALALACSPKLLLADEPTTGLDVTLTREILGLFKRAATESDAGVLLISHDLASVSTVCDRVVGLYAGMVVEEGPTARLLREPAHPYTKALVASVPDLDGRPVLATRGTMPLLHMPPTSCPFADRCDRADEVCRASRPELRQLSVAGRVACFHPIEANTAASAPAPSNLSDGEQAAHVSSPSDAPASSGLDVPGQPERPATTPALAVENISVSFRSQFGRGTMRALREVSLTVEHGESVGIVGESGSGKSTLARVITGLQPTDSGTVKVNGLGLGEMSRQGRRELSKNVQMVFQDPQGALSPRRTVLDAVGEPLRALGLARAERDKRAAATVARTGLNEAVLNRRPSQLSGGQAQRVGIARALVADPDLVVLDEPTSALDVTVQAQVLDLIRGLAEERTRSFLFISHDLATVRGFCDRVIVLYLGTVVEEGPVEQVFAEPLHPYTRTLLTSVPRLRPGTSLPPVRLSRDIDQAEVASGCPLRTRCPFADEECAKPQELVLLAPGRRVACHRAREIQGQSANGAEAQSSSSPSAQERSPK